MKFMRKYIHVAKDMKPILTREAAEHIAEEYSKLRNHDNMQADNVARVSYPVCLHTCGIVVLICFVLPLMALDTFCRNICEN